MRQRGARRPPRVHGPSPRASIGLTASESAAAALHVGTSGFSYPDWRPRFYPRATPASRFLAEYARRLDAVELNATFRRRPTRSAIEGWLRATPPDFRFAVKAQRGSALRALLGSPVDSIAWLTEPLPAFGDRLGAVLLRIPREIRRDGPWNGGDATNGDRALAALLAAWPRSFPLVVELQDPSWHVDETFAALTGAGATLCATDRADGDEPILRRTSGRLYLRLRREDYDAAALDRWADRIRPFLGAGDEVFAFFRHDPVGHAGELAEALRARLGG